MGMFSAIFDFCVLCGFECKSRHFAGARSSKVIAQPVLWFARLFIFVFVGHAGVQFKNILG